MRVFKNWLSSTAQFAWINWYSLFLIEGEIDQQEEGMHLDTAAVHRMLMGQLKRLEVLEWLASTTLSTMPLKTERSNLADSFTSQATNNDSPNSKKREDTKTVTVLEGLAAHKARRPAHWKTVELDRPDDLVAILRDAAPADVLLIDCMTLWLTSLVDAYDAWEDEGTVAPRSTPSWRACSRRGARRRLRWSAPPTRSARASSRRPHRAGTFATSSAR